MSAVRTRGEAAAHTETQPAALGWSRVEEASGDAVGDDGALPGWLDWNGAVSRGREAVSLEGAVMHMVLKVFTLKYLWHDSAGRLGSC